MSQAVEDEDIVEEHKDILLKRNLIKQSEEEIL